MKKSVPGWLVGGLILIGLIFFFLAREEGHKTKKEEEYSKSASYRPVYHFSAPDKWKNDPQKPVFIEGKYHYYYLYNRDYPGGNGTEWRHATSADLVHWKDEGIAIPKYTTENGDIWSGSVVYDKNNSAGFGKGAVIAIVTQPSADGQQGQYLWYSTNNGNTFQPYSEEPVMPNPGTKDFRDPKVVWDEQTKKWVMTLAEGTKIGFYESANLKDWQYTSGFSTKNIGLVECPDLFRMQASDGTFKWVLGVSANGKAAGKPNTYAYWTGDYNGKEFIPDREEPEWLDYGFDWYGGVTFEDGTRQNPDTRYAFAWMNNWDYPHSTPTQKEGFNGVDSIVRQIKLVKDVNHQYHLTSQPVKALNQLTVSADQFQKIEVTGSKTLHVQGDAYQLEADISWTDAENVGLRLRESLDKTRHIDAGIYVKENVSYVNRGFTNHPDSSGKFLESQAPFEAGKKEVHVTVLVDQTSIEMFVGDGRVTHSSQVFPRLEDQGITLFSEGGAAVFENVTIKHFRPIHQQQIETK